MAWPIYTSNQYQGLIRKVGNRSGAAGVNAIPGVVITGGVLDTLHTLPTGRSFYLTKIMWQNPTGANITLALGTLSNAAVFVQFFPTITALAGITGGLGEADLPAAEFMLNSQAAPNGWDGNLYCVSSAALALITVEVAEKS